jgi:hypothetical protein
MDRPRLNALGKPDSRFVLMQIFLANLKAPRITRWGARLRHVMCLDGAALIVAMALMQNQGEDSVSPRFLTPGPVHRHFNASGALSDLQVPSAS